MWVRAVIDQSMFKWLLSWQQHNMGCNMVDDFIDTLKTQSTTFERAITDSPYHRKTIYQIIHRKIYHWVKNPVAVAIEQEEAFRSSMYMMLLTLEANDVQTYVVPLTVVQEEFSSIESVYQLNQSTLALLDDKMYIAKKKMIQILSTNSWDKYLLNPQRVVGVLISRQILLYLRPEDTTPKHDIDTPPTQRH